MVTRQPSRSARHSAAGTTPLADSAPARSAHPTARAVPRLLQRAMPGTAGERMSKVDTAWLRMDTPGNLMMINGVWTLSPGIDWHTLCQRAQQRMLQYPRFHQRVVQDVAGATWVQDTHFDITAHVVRTTLPRRKGQSQHAALQQRVGELSTQPLDSLRPLWQFHLIEDFVGDDGQPGSALILRIHHCIADGIALIGVILSLVDGGTEPPPPQAPKAPADSDDWLTNALLKPLTDLTVKALDKAGDSAAASLYLLREPEKALEHGLAGTLDAVRVGRQVLADIAELALMPDDSPTRLKGVPGQHKRVAWCPPLPLSDVKAVGAALNCSLNDVLLSCVAGAIGGYLRRHGDATEGQEIRAMVPVNLRSEADAWQLGNRFGLAPLVLPIGIINPIERVYEVRRRMAALKGSTQPLLTYGLLAVAGLLVKPAQDALLGLFSRKTTAVMTNVPGPDTPLTLCGARLTQCMVWVPQSGSVGLGVSILSYNGGVQFGVMTDTLLCPDPQQIIDAFAPEFEQLLWLTLLLP
ncbi:MAG: wax ester/triacylglycerol synthase family O-acyltransferase [Simplicispira sp.]|nr:wax ester/triacylglycerol synthase family O-acyltransferase [Simplicispira sp.]